MNLQRALFVIVTGIVGGLLAIGCTVVRYPPDSDGGNVTTGEPFGTVDVLVLVDLNRSTSNLTPQYGQILGGLIAGMEEQDIAVRRAAMAPLHRRAGDVVPLIYGEDDPDAEFASFAEALAFFARDDGLAYIPDDATGEAENLALLGADLGQRAIYHPTTADPDGTAYYRPPADALIVVILSSSDRLCAHDTQSCGIDGLSAADYVTEADADGATWLNFPGGTSLPTNKVFFAPIVTAEGVGYDDFYSGCIDLPNFPASLIDVMEPGAERFWGPFADKVVDRGGQAEFVDICEAMSSRGPSVLGGVVGKIRIML